MDKEEFRIQPAPIFTDGMVLQREVPLRLWGQAAPGERLEIRLRGSASYCQADGAGRWIVELPPQDAGGPFDLAIKGASGELVIRDVLIGDVWLLGGQSNMAMSIAGTLDLYAEEVRAVENPWIRQFRVPTAYDFQGPRLDISPGAWREVTPENVLEFSALGYFFAQAHYARYRVPVGLVLTAVGGSHIEAWLSEETIQSAGGYEEVVARLKQPGYLEGLLQSELDRGLAWLRDLDARDLGRQGKVPWSSSELDDSGWKTVTMPRLWKGTELENFHGVVWLRREVELDEAAAGREALLRLGAIVDADEVYINGVQVGRTEYKYPLRKYQVPAGLLRAGRNTIAVRVFVARNTGGFVEGKKYALEVGGRSIDLSGEWKYERGCSAQSLPKYTRPHHFPSGMYNAMIAPLQGCVFRGVLWYQGESNAHNPERYQDLFTALITTWRKHFDQPELPFFFVQLTNYDTAYYEEADPERWALVREAQLNTLQVPYTAMAVTIDVGEGNDLHPQNKKDIALRLHRAARHLIFGEPVAYQSPLHERLEREGSALRLYFTGADGGLTSRGGELKWFEICGTDGIFHPAQALVEGETVKVWSEAVPEPAGVRYAWRDNPEGANLFSAGLPASPFRAYL